MSITTNDKQLDTEYAESQAQSTHYQKIKEKSERLARENEELEQENARLSARVQSGGLVKAFSDADEAPLEQNQCLMKKNKAIQQAKAELKKRTASPNGTAAIGKLFKTPGRRG